MAQTDKAAKQRYARELAAYTLEQWNVARARQLARDKEAKGSPMPQSKLDSLPASSAADHLPKDDATAVAMKAIDYALSSQQNGET